MTSKTNNKNSKNSQDTKKKFDQYNGGRSLNAIWSCTNIDAHQTIILLWLASRLDFRTDFSGPIRISQNVIAAKTKMSKRTVIRKILKLEEQGYLTCTEYNSVNEYRLTRKIFEEYTESPANTASDTESPANTASDRESLGGDRESLGGDTESHQYSPSYPFSFPFNLGAPLLDVMTYVNQGRVTFTTIDNKQTRDTESQSVSSDGMHVDTCQIEPQDKADTRLSQKREGVVPIADHPLTALLKESSQKRKAEKAAKSNDTATIQKQVSNTTRKSSEGSEALFKNFQSYFRGGSGRFCYKAQRAFWARVIQDNLVEEAKATLTFFHGVDKPTAQVAAGNKRMSDDDYVNFLYEEALGIRTREEKDRKVQEDIERESEERQKIINSLTPEEKARREERLRNMKRMLKNVHHYTP